MPDSFELLDDFGSEFYGSEPSDSQKPFSFRDRLKHGWNAFKNKDPSSVSRQKTYMPGLASGMSSSYRPDRRRIPPSGTDQTIAGAIITRISTDAASVVVHHCRVDESGGFLSEIQSGLNECLTVSANIDQTGRAFIQDLVASMLDEGVIAAVPIDTTVSLSQANTFDIQSMRTGRIVQWFPDSVQLEAYNERKGIKELIYMPKDKIAIVENPFYSIMNEPNSVLKRLTRKLTLLDAVDEQSASSKLDLILQLPYTIKSETREAQAERRRQKIEEQLQDSKYGIAYIDGTERITQLNRSVENNLLNQIEYLTSMLYSQLGITQEILNGSASEDTMRNYYVRTVDVILTAIVDEFTRKFLTKTARTQNQRIQYFRDPFRLTSTNALAELADKFTRNEVLAPNEVRGIIGFKPSSDPKADELRNRNINQSTEERASWTDYLDQMEGETIDGV